MNDEIYRTDAIDICTDFRMKELEAFYPVNFFDDGWWSVVLELREVSIRELVRISESNGLGLIIAPFYDEEELAERPEVQFVPAHAQRDFILAANMRDGELPVSGMKVGGPVSTEELNFSATPLPHDGFICVPEGAVVTAVIDSGIAFAHELFRTSETDSRVEFAWIMDGAPKSPHVPKGRELARTEIDQLLSRNTHSGLLDEWAFYREAGLIDFAREGFKPAAMRLSHGTHVMGLATGIEPDLGENARPIIAVQLPTKLVADVSGIQLHGDLAHALRYIRRRANRMRIDGDPTRRPPIVLNFSFGDYAGPHDSTGLIARMLDRWLTAPAAKQTRRLTLPAGNGNLARCHAEIGFTGGFVEARLDWRVQPSDRSASYVEMWMPWRPAAEDEGLVSVTVKPPGGPETAPVGAHHGEEAPILAGGVHVGRIGFQKAPWPTDRGVIHICILPSFRLEGDAEVAPAGLWEIAIAKEGIEADEVVQVWIERDETLRGHPVFGRQSYFDNACYQRFDSEGRRLPVDPVGSDCIVRRAGTLSGFAAGAHSCVIAGFVRSDGRLAPYSAAGPITPARDQIEPVRTGPDASAVSDDSPILQGVLSAGSRCGTRVAMNGTSVAAPQAAWWIAKRLGEEKTSDRKAVEQKGADDDGSFPGAKPPNDRAGGGRMNLTPRLGRQSR